MKKNLISMLFTAALLIAVFYGCNKPAALKTLTPSLPAVPYTYTNGSFFGNDNTPFDNVMTDNGATLGRLLFYDPRLSLNNTVSCASCHHQQEAFADGEATSVGFETMRTKRNSMAIINAGSKSSFFWDGRATSLEQMVLMPVQHHVEMGMEKLDVMEKKIASVSYYPDLFKKAFGTEDVTRDKISKALAQFIRSLRSDRSRFDIGALSQEEQDGFMAFQKFQCSTCHFGNDFGGAPLFGGYSGNTEVANAANIGLDVDYADKGIKEITGNAALDGAFIIPSLRNLTFTAPYMHDGRFTTIEEVIEHYNSGIQPNQALDHHLTKGSPAEPVKMNMTEAEKAALAAFLRSLSDATVTTDVKFSNPFK